MSTRKAPAVALLFASVAFPAGSVASLALALAPQAAASSAETLDRLLAPIALYPDALLAQILLCSGDAGRVVQLSAWLKENAALKASELQDAAQKAGFEASYVALAPFPQVVEMMAGDTKWTGQLGRAFAADRNAVFDSIQRLRGQSQAVGNLKSTPQQTVESKTTESGQQVIVIEPANPQVVYVPQYNPQVVYTQPATTTTVVVHEEHHDDSAAVAAGVIGFAAGIAIGAAVNNNYYYGPYGWRGGGYMYSSGWNDFYDDREDAREDFYENRDDARDDWADHREDMAGERSDRAENASEQRGDRQQNAQEQRTQRQEQRGSSETQAQRDQRRTDAQAKADSRRSGGEGTASASATSARSTDGTRQARSGEPRSGGAASTYESRGKSGERTGAAAAERSGTRSDAFSNYSSGRSTRSESSRGQRSRSSSSGGGRSRKR